MNMPPVDLGYLREHFEELAALVHEAWESSNTLSDEVDAPSLLTDAMRQLVGMLGHVQTEGAAGDTQPSEINTLGEFGLHLLEELTQLATRLGRPELAIEIENLAMPYSLWIARQGGEIRKLEPVVNALARYANQAARPQAIMTLYNHCCELIDATNPGREEPASRDPHHPWRLLLLNRAIIATRSENPELMAPAFDAIIEYLPDDAPRFFAEGMEQMEIIDYPEHVRHIVRRYFLAHAVPKRLH